MIKRLYTLIALILYTTLLTACGKSVSSLSVQTSGQSTTIMLTANGSAVRDALSAILSTGGSPAVTDLQIVLANGVVNFAGNSHQGNAVNPFRGTLQLSVQNHWLAATVTSLTSDAWTAQAADLQRINQSIANGLNSVLTQNQGSLQIQRVEVTTDQLVIQAQTPMTSSGGALFGLSVDSQYYHVSITVTQENVLSLIVSANYSAPKPFIKNPGLAFQNGLITFDGDLPSSPTITYPIVLSISPGVSNGNLTLAVTGASAFGYALPADSIKQINARVNERDGTAKTGQYRRNFSDEWPAYCAFSRCTLMLIMSRLSFGRAINWVFPTVTC